MPAHPQSRDAPAADQAPAQSPDTPCPACGPDAPPVATAAATWTLPPPGAAVPLSEQVTQTTGACRSGDPGAAGYPSVPGYEILAELGRGGMGVVYQARQTGLNRVVALKMILSGAHAGPDLLARFRTEAEALARLQHPNIVQVHEVGIHDGRPFFSLEFCGGGSLDRKLQATPLPPEEAAALAETLARAVHAAHVAHVIHRDLKPANVLLTADGTPKITDFGLAKKLDEMGQTLTGEVMGTPGYMAPEQADGSLKCAGPAADVYALGSILYETLTGRPPFRGVTPVETVLQLLSQEPLPPRLLNPRVPADLEKITLKCLEKRPEQRYESAAALADDLRRFREGEPVRAHSINLFDRLQWALAHSAHDSTLRPWGLGLIILGIVVFCAQLVTSLLLLAHAPEPLCYWLPRTVAILAAIPLLLRYRPHAGLWPTNAVERLIWAVWVGYLLTFASLSWVMHILGRDHLQIYGVATAVSGLAWFIMGGHAWGGCYVIGGVFLAMAPVLAVQAGSAWSPFYFGVLWSAALVTLGGRYRKMG